MNLYSLYPHVGLSTKLVKYSRLFTTLLVCVALSACSTSPTQKIDYRSSSSLSPLEVPPDLTKLPSDASENADTYSAYAAERQTAKIGSSTLLPDFKNIQAKRDGDIRWLKIKANKKELWIDIKNFLGDIGLVIKSENPATGIIETDWAENQADFQKGGYLGKLLSSFQDTGQRDKYRIRMEEDPQSGWYDVYIAHQGLVEKVVASTNDGSFGQTSWVRRPSDPGLEAEMLRLLMVYLGVDNKDASTMLASGIRKARAELKTDPQSDARYILVKASMIRTKRRLETTLDRLGAKTTSSEDDGKLVTFTYLLPEEEKINSSGFFTRLFQGGKKRAGAYRVKLQASGEETNLSLVDKSGKPDTSDRAKELLGILFDKLK